MAGSEAQGKEAGKAKQAEGQEMPRSVVEPTEKPSSTGGVEYSHPCFGMAQFTRCTGLADNLHGSSILHQNTIRLTISRSRYTRNLSCDWHHPTEELIEVEMSENQFATLVSSVASGSGTPCTLRMTENQRTVPSCPPVTERRRINDEFEAYMREASEQLQHAANKLDQLIAAKSVTKGDLRIARDAVGKALQDMASNAAFVHSQFNEACDATVAEARAEVEAAFGNLIGKLGHQKLIEMAGVTHPPHLAAIEGEVPCGRPDMAG